MSEQQQPGKEFRFNYQDAEVTIRLSSPAGLPPPGDTLELPKMPLNPGWRYLSDLGERVLRTLAEGGGEMTTLEICEALGASPTGKGKDTLSDLAERGVLVSGPGGYRLATPSGVGYRDYCTSLLAWLDSQKAESPAS